MKNNELYQPYWCIHHEGTPVNGICIPLEFNYEPIQNRIDFIKTYKPKNEIPIRLNALRKVLGELPIEVIEAIKACDEADKACDEAYKARNEALKACDEADKSYREALKACNEAIKACDEACKAYREAYKARNEALKAYDEARKACDEAILKNKDKIMELFHQECPDVQWDMEKGLVFGTSYQGRLYGKNNPQ